ncbi:MAG: sulfite oxidase heme-binding subunit YedZ [Aggregatilineales bacterium]
MQKRLKKNLYWLSVSIAAISVIALILSESGMADTFPNTHLYRMERTGVWSIRFLLLSLAMSPLYRLLGWRWTLKLRKPLGLWAFFFGAWHFMTYINNQSIDDALKTIFDNQYYLLGFIGLSILFVLALTSHPIAMRRLRHNWKRLHRLVYLAGILVIMHSILMFGNTKSSFLKDAGFVNELKLYLVIIGILFVLRFSRVQRIIHQIIGKPKRRYKPKTMLQSS